MTTDVRFTAHWNAKSQSLGNYVETLRSFLRDLQELHPIFADLRYAGSNAHAAQRLGPNLERLPAIAFEHAWNTRSPSHFFTDLSSDGRPTRATVSDTGFFMLFENGEPHERQHEYVTVGVRAGASSNYVGNAVVIKTPWMYGAPLVECNVARRVLEAVIDHWPAQIGRVTTSDFHAITRASDDIGSIDWMTYFANPAVADALPPGVEHHPFGPGGVLIVTAPTMPSPEDPAADLARDIAQRLRARGLMPK